MINIKPVGDQVKIRATGLYQWDEFQTLEFEDPYPEGTEVHFSHKGKLIAMVYLLEEGSVKIPNLLLQKASPIMAWVYVDGKTVLEIEMPVERRAMPSGYIGVPDGDQHSIEPRTILLEQWQLEAIARMTDIEDDVTALTTELTTARNGETSLDERLDGIDLAVGDRYTKAEADAKLALKANKQQEAWITPTLLNGATAFDSVLNPIGYYKDSMDVVRLRGLIKPIDNVAVFTLPVGYRPAKTIIPVVRDSQGATKVNYITAVGSVVLDGQKAYAGYISLDAISFRAEV